MTPRQRLLATLRRREHDRVPLVLEGFLHASRDGVAAVADGLRREIAERVFEHSHFWVHCNAAVNRYLVTPGQRLREVSRTERDGEVTVVTEIDTPRGPLTAVTGHNRTTETTRLAMHSTCCR